MGVSVKMNDIFEQVEKNIDNLVVNQADWTASATKEELDAAREGKLTLHFFDKIVPKEWLMNIKGKKILCLAGAGGLQAPLLACAGAKVTVIDISNKMLDKDREIAKRENLSIEIVKGKGSFVLSEDIPPQKMDQWYRAKTQAFSNLVEIRVALECLATREAAKKMTDEVLSKLQILMMFLLCWGTMKHSIA